jgi:hypothetical protein
MPNRSLTRRSLLQSRALRQEPLSRLSKAVTTRIGTALAVPFVRSEHHRFRSAIDNLPSGRCEEIDNSKGLFLNL